MRDLRGEQLGPYRIVGPIGEGGMAAVYKAYQPSMDRYVALKILHPFFVSDPSFAGRFKQEATVLGKLQHPHILPTYDSGTAGEYAFIVMPLVDTGTLTDWLKRGPLPLDQIHRTISQIGSALDFAHSMGIVHRDIKPSNILLDRQGNCLLGDFGIAKIVEGTSVFTQTGGLIGTPAYMSPEQIRGEKLDGRSDLYALGVVLYEMATGRAPFEAETPPAVLIKHLLDPLPPPSTHNPRISEDLERVILKGLAKDPKDRFQTGADMANSLAQSLTAEGAAPMRPSPTRQMALSPARPRPKLRLPAWALGLIGVVVIAALIAAWVALSGPSDGDASLAAQEATAESLTGTAIAAAVPQATATPPPPSPVATATPIPQPSDTPVPATTWTPTATEPPSPTVVKPTRIPTRSDPYVLAGQTGVNVRSGPGTIFPVIDSLPANGQAEVTGKFGGWWQISIDRGLGWVYGDVVTPVNTEDVRNVQPPPSPTPVPAATWTPAPAAPPPPPAATDTPSPATDTPSPATNTPQPQPTPTR